MRTIEFPLPSGDTIFCDDIRQEINGKLTLVGVYHGQMIVGELPGLLPRLCCFVTLRQDPKSNDDITIKIIWEPDDGDDAVISEATIQTDNIARGPVEPSTKKGPVISLFKTFFEISPFGFSGPGRLKARAYIADAEIKLGALIVSKGDIPALD